MSALGYAFVVAGLVVEAVVLLGFGFMMTGKLWPWGRK